MFELKGKTSWESVKKEAAQTAFLVPLQPKAVLVVS